MEVIDDQNRPIRLWTFDGGGIAVISELVIVQEIMERIQAACKLSTIPHPHEFADLMVGTEFGAVAVILMTRLQLTAEETLDEIANICVSIDKHSEIDGDSSASQDALDDAIKLLLQRHNLLPETTLSNAAEQYPFGAVTTLFERSLSTCHLITTYSSVNQGHGETVSNTLRAVLATPPRFRPVMVRSGNFQEPVFSGAIGYNNPAKKAIEEAKRIFGENRTISLMISLGSGRRPPPRFQVTSETKYAQLLEETLSNTEVVADALFQRFAQSSIYYRLSPGTIIEYGAPLNSQDIIENTKDYLQTPSVSATLDSVVTQLLNREGSYTLGQIDETAVKPINAKEIPRLSPYYVHRSGVFEDMEYDLINYTYDTPPIYILVGLPGSGKTQCLSYFYQKHRERYDYTFFVNAGSASSIKTDLETAIRSLGGKHSQANFSDAIQFLTSLNNRRWLLIFDGADDPRLKLEQFFPKGGQGCIIITSCSRELSSLSPWMFQDLTFVTIDEAVEILFKAAKLPPLPQDEVDQSASALCETLGRLSLTLVNVGCYCHETGTSFAEYQTILKNHRAKLMKAERTPQLDGYYRSVYSSFEPLYSLLEKEQREFLHILAFFHASPVPLDIFRIAVQWSLEDTHQILRRDENHGKIEQRFLEIVAPGGEWDVWHMNEVLKNLNSRSFVSISDHNEMKMITVHKLVQAWAKDMLSNDERDLYFRVTACTLSSCARMEEGAIFRYLPTHIEEILGSRQSKHPNERAAFGFIFQKLGRHSEALEQYEQAKADYSSSQHQPESQILTHLQSESILSISTNIGWCLSRVGLREDAVTTLQNTADLQKQLLGSSHKDTLKSIHTLAATLRSYRQYEESKILFNAILEVRRAQYGANDPGRFLALAELAITHSKLKEYSRADELFEEATQKLQTLFKKDDLRLLAVRSEHASNLMHQSRWGAALKIFQETASLKAKVWGETHEKTLHTRYGLGLCLYCLLELEEAKACLGEVLEIQRKKHGEGHPSTIKTQKLYDRVVDALMNGSTEDPPSDTETVNSWSESLV